jgi:hypothetical protein
MPQNAPLRVTYYNDGNLAARQILPIAQVFVRCQKNFKARRFRHVEQVTVNKAIPPPISCLRDGMSLEMEA